MSLDELSKGTSNKSKTSETLSISKTSERVSLTEIVDIDKQDMITYCVFRFPVKNAAIIQVWNAHIGEAQYKLNFDNPNKEEVENAVNIHKYLGLFDKKSIVHAEYIHNPPLRSYTPKIANFLELILELTQREIELGLACLELDKIRLSETGHSMKPKIFAYPYAKFEYSSKEFKTIGEAQALARELNLIKTCKTRISIKSESYRIYRHGLFSKTYTLSGWKCEEFDLVVDFTKKFYHHKDKFESLSLFSQGKIQKIYPAQKEKK